MEGRCGRTGVLTGTRSNIVSHSLVVLATRSITSHLIGQCIQRVVENYYSFAVYANTSTTALHTRYSS